MLQTSGWTPGIFSLPGIPIWLAQLHRAEVQVSLLSPAYQRFSPHAASEVDSRTRIDETGLSYNRDARRHKAKRGGRKGTTAGAFTRNISSEANKSERKTRSLSLVRRETGPVRVANTTEVAGNGARIAVIADAAEAVGCTPPR